METQTVNNICMTGHNSSTSSNSNSASTQKLGSMKANVKKKVFRCELCQATKGSLRELSNHVISHIGAMPYYCLKCYFTTISLTKLYIHLMKHIEFVDENDEKQRRLRAVLNRMVHVCSICNISFKFYSDLISHYIAHTRNFYKCVNCSYVFSSESDCLIHSHLHDSVSCRVCSLEFGRCHNNLYLNHVRGHDFTKLYRKFPKDKVDHKTIPYYNTFFEICYKLSSFNMHEDSNVESMVQNEVLQTVKSVSNSENQFDTSLKEACKVVLEKQELGFTLKSSSSNIECHATDLGICKADTNVERNCPQSNRQNIQETCTTVEKEDIFIDSFSPNPPMRTYGKQRNSVSVQNTNLNLTESPTHSSEFAETGISKAVTNVVGNLPPSNPQNIQETYITCDELIILKDSFSSKLPVGMAGKRKSVLPHLLNTNLNSTKRQRHTFEFAEICTGDGSSEIKYVELDDKSDRDVNNLAVEEDASVIVGTSMNKEGTNNFCVPSVQGLFASPKSISDTIHLKQKSSKEKTRNLIQQRKNFATKKKKLVNAVHPFSSSGKEMTSPLENDSIDHNLSSLSNSDEDNSIHLDLELQNLKSVLSEPTFTSTVAKMMDYNKAMLRPNVGVSNVETSFNHHAPASPRLSLDDNRNCNSQSLSTNDHTDTNYCPEIAPQKCTRKKQLLDFSTIQCRETTPTETDLPKEKTRTSIISTELSVSSGLACNKHPGINNGKPLKRLSVQVQRLPNEILSAAMAAVAQKDANSQHGLKELSVVMHKLPGHVCDFESFEEYEDKGKRYNTRQRKKQRVNSNTSSNQREELSTCSIFIAESSKQGCIQAHSRRSSEVSLNEQSRVEESRAINLSFVNEDQTDSLSSGEDISSSAINPSSLNELTNSDVCDAMEDVNYFELRERDSLEQSPDTDEEDSDELLESQDSESTSVKLKVLKLRIHRLNNWLESVKEIQKEIWGKELHVELHKLPNDVVDRYQKGKPIMLSNILPVIRNVQSVSREIEYY